MIISSYDNVLCINIDNSLYFYYFIGSYIVRIFMLNNNILLILTFIS